MDINSLFFWWPSLKDKQMPKTTGVIFDMMNIFPILDGEPALNAPWATLAEAAEEIGFPVFVRTDMSSAKHRGPKAYRMNEPGDLRRVLALTLEDNYMKNIEGKVCGFVFRQWD